MGMNLPTIVSIVRHDDGSSITHRLRYKHAAVFQCTLMNPNERRCVRFRYRSGEHTCVGMVASSLLIADFQAETERSR